MTTTSIVSVLVAAFGGLGFMAYRHHKWFMPFSQGVLTVLLPLWGGMLGFEIAVVASLRKIPEAGHEAIRKDIKELGASINSSLVVYCLIGLFILRQVSEYIHTEKQREHDASKNT